MKNESIALKDRLFAVPQWLVSEKIKELRECGIDFDRKDVMVDGFKVAACIFPKKNLSQVRKIINPSGGLNCVLGGERLPMLTMQKLPVTIEKEEKKEKYENYQEYLELLSALLPPYTSILQKFFAITGIHPYLHLNGSDIKAPFPPGGKIHIFSNSRPPGLPAKNYSFRSTVFGMPISSDPEKSVVKTMCPILGRGIVLKDDEGPIVQIIGGNFYFFTPMVMTFNPITSPLIFEKVLALAWNEYRKNFGMTGKKPAKQLEILKVAGEWANSRTKSLEEMLKDTEEKIQGFQEMLAIENRKRREYATLLNAFSSSDFLKGTLARIPEDFQKIGKLPGVKKVYVIDENINVETQPIVVRHEDKCYQTGEFTISLNRFGMISIWNDNPLHPKGIPHPHISDEGVACFGNATDAITSAAGEYRNYDVINYLIQWLEDGYDHELAAVKITEWPEVKNG